MKTMLRTLALVVLSMSCDVPDVTVHELVLIEPEPDVVDAGDLLADEEPEVIVVPEEPEPEPVVTVPVIQVRQRLVPYRNPRYITQCRRASRRDAEVSRVVESRDEARTRARALARSGELNEVLILARMAYGEHGTPREGRNDDPRTPEWDEAWAILAVMDSLRGQMSRVEMMVNYAPRRVFPGSETARQRWISELRLDGTRPPSWPRPRGRRFYQHPGWQGYGCPRWLATVDAVRALLRRHPDRVEAGPCDEVPDHWGGAMDDHRAIQAGWRRVQCGRGNTLNRFWVVPERAAQRLGRSQVPEVPTSPLAAL